MVSTKKQLIALAVVIIVSGLVFADDSKREDVIARHLQSIGAPEVRQTAKSRVKPYIPHRNSRLRTEPISRVRALNRRAIVLKKTSAISNPVMA